MPGECAAGLSGIGGSAGGVRAAAIGGFGPRDEAVVRVGDEGGSGPLRIYGKDPEIARSGTDGKGGRGLAVISDANGAAASGGIRRYEESDLPGRGVVDGEVNGLAAPRRSARRCR